MSKNEECGKASPRASQRKRHQRFKRQNMELASCVTITPWIHFQEYVAVGRALLAAGGVCLRESPESDDELDASEGAKKTAIPRREWTFTLEQALERVEIWKLRSHELPHAVDATQALACCLCNDQQSVPPTVSTTSLCLSYAAAVIRCINGLTDVLQQNRATAASIAHLSSLLGIPSWLVDIRHQSTHNQLPSLSVLRTASVTLLQYLQQVYWQPMVHQRQEQCRRARQLLREYAQVAENIWKAKHTITPDPDTKGKRKREDLLTKICDPASYQGTTFNRFAVLMDEKKSAPKEPPSSAEISGCSTGKKRKRESSANVRTLWSLARAYTKHPNLPLNLLYEMTLESLLNVNLPEPEAGKPEADALSGPSTTAPSSLDAAEPEMYRLYLPLLLTLTRQFPGSAAAFMSHAVHSTLPQFGQDNEKDQMSVLTLQWMDSLLSDECCLRDDTGAGGVGVVSSSLVPFRSLLDQCLKVDTDQGHSVAQQLTKRLQDPATALSNGQNCTTGMIGEHVASNHSMLPTNAVCSPAQPQVLTALTLEEMEALTENTGGKVDSVKNTSDAGDDCKPVAIVHHQGRRDTPSTLDCRRAWVRCEFWEECSIGTLPGQLTS